MHNQTVCRVEDAKQYAHYPLQSLCYLISFIVLGQCLLCLIKYLRLYVWHQIFPADLVKKYGRWAIVTGATDGIGLSIAKELARRGHSIVIFGRNPEKLKRVKAEVESLCKADAEVKTVKIDFATAGSNDYERIKAEINLDTMDIGILINNAGISPLKNQLFQKFNDQDGVDLVNVNCLSYARMARVILPYMVRRNKGLVINIASVLQENPALYVCLYGPTKAFVYAFTKQLQLEYSDYDVKFMNIAPGYVQTKMIEEVTNLSHPNRLLNPDPDSFAKCMLNATSAGLHCFAGWFGHELYMLGGKFFLSIGMYKFIFDINTRAHVRDHDLPPMFEKRTQIESKSDNASQSPPKGKD